MESKKCNRVYFAGEILDIDAITGGYNFQAAWTSVLLLKIKKLINFLIINILKFTFLKSQQY